MYIVVVFSYFIVFCE